MRHADEKDKEAGPLPPLSGFDADGDAPPSLGIEDEAALDLSQPPPLPRNIDSRGEPETVFDTGEADAAPLPPRELHIAPEPESYALATGEVLNERFEILKLLDTDALGMLYLVQDLRLKERKALKLMHPALVKDPDASEQFIEEIKTLQKLSHENIVRLYDFGKTDHSDLSFFTMEYVKGTTLASLLKKKGGRLPLEKGLAIIYQILDALAYAHQHSTSRNLNPNNIIIRPSGKVVLLNFGVIEGKPANPLERRSALGRTHYQAPEQRLDPTVSTPQADLYAVGVLLYQLLTGEIPLGQPKPPSQVNRHLPRRFNAPIMRCLAASPEKRFRNATEARTAIQKAVRSSFLPMLALAAVVLALLSALMFGWVYYRSA